MSNKTVETFGLIQHLMTIHSGSTKSPTERSATDREAKYRLEIVRNESFLKNSHRTAAFPVTAAKPEKENHNDRTMDAVLLRSSRGWLSFMV